MAKKHNNECCEHSECCDFCNEIDDIAHFLLLCPNIRAFWKSWAKWWFSVTKTDITHVDDLQENILFGFVSSNGITDILNYCILYTKYYIYIKGYLIKTNLMPILT